MRALPWRRETGRGMSTLFQWRTSCALATCDIDAHPAAAITLGKPKTWSPCKCEMKMRDMESGAMPARTICSCADSPQSNSHVSPSTEIATVCWLRLVVGAALDVPRKISSIRPRGCDLRVLEIFSWCSRPAVNFARS
jgi:hypothetical protein